MVVVVVVVVVLTCAFTMWVSVHPPVQVGAPKSGPAD